MKNPSEEPATPAASIPRQSRDGPGQTVLVFQGGGALGAYQAGVYQAMHEATIEPDWIIGTSIGAINAALIAGNAPEDRLPRLKEFWNRVSHKSWWNVGAIWPQFAQPLSYWNTLVSGIPGFFTVNPWAHLGHRIPIGAEQAGFYSTAPLETTLLQLVDFDRIRSCKPRLTIGAAQVKSSKMCYFDNRDITIGVKHIMASGALPPAFPAVRIDGELYWDGGILSNTPTEVVFDDFPRRNSLVFAVHLWNPDGAEPQTISDVLNRHKDIQYSSRVSSHITRQMQTHHLRHVIKELASHLPPAIRNSTRIKELEGWGCQTRMHVVRLLAPNLAHEDQAKDVDFSPAGIRSRWEAGYANAMEAIVSAPWNGEFDPLEGVILHECGSAV